MVLSCSEVGNTQHISVSRSLCLHRVQLENFSPPHNLPSSLLIKQHRRIVLSFFLSFFLPVCQSVCLSDMAVCLSVCLCVNITVFGQWIYLAKLMIRSWVMGSTRLRKLAYRQRTSSRDVDSIPKSLTGRAEIGCECQNIEFIFTELEISNVSQRRLQLTTLPTGLSYIIHTDTEQSQACFPIGNLAQHNEMKEWPQAVGCQQVMLKCLLQLL